MICVRYLFAAPAGLRQHLRLGKGLYLPGNEVYGGRVAVEIVYGDGSAGILIHGIVSVRTREGVVVDTPVPLDWLPDYLARRVERRIPCDAFAEVKPRGGAPWLCRVLDLSESGVR